MIPVDQRGTDDCLRACLASIFEIPYDEVPDTAEPALVDLRGWGSRERALASAQHKLVADWLAERGLARWQMRMAPEDNPVLRRGVTIQADGSRDLNDSLWPWPPIQHYLGGGRSPRGHWHSVVMHQGRIVHDPHPDRDMTIERIDEIEAFVARLRGSE